MSKRIESGFRYDELIVIAGALADNIRTLQEALGNSSVDFLMRVQLQKDLHSAESALKKISSLLGIDPPEER